MIVMDYEIEDLDPKMGVKLIKTVAHEDERGYFMEGFNKETFREFGINSDFTQYNVSKSKYGVLRGMHFQKPPYAQAKFVRCLTGEIFDVAIDLRKGSPTYGKYVSAVLSGENKTAIFIPRGFAHGFLVTSKEDAIVLYLVDNKYDPKSEGGIRWDDPVVNINWPFKPLIMSKKDKTWPTLNDVKIELWKNMVKVLVIGASGLLGKAFMEIGKNYNFEITGTYFTHPIQNGLQLDLRNREKVFEIVQKLKPDIIIDTHALNDVDYCELHPEEAWDLNVNATRNIAEASKIVGSKYIFFSSDYVFDGNKSEYTEKDKPNPLNYYGKTKWVAELILKVLDIDYIVARTSGLYGSTSSAGKKSFLIWLIENLRANKRVEVVSDQYLSFTYVEDLAKTIFDLYKKDARGIYHAVGKDCISKYEFAIQISKKFGLNSSLIAPTFSANLRLAAKRPIKVKLNLNKLSRAIGHTLMGVEEGLEEIKGKVELWKYC